MLIEKISMDIRYAKLGLEHASADAEYMYDGAAYHVQQAIEKELKYLLHNVFHVDDTTKDFKIHNIAALLTMLEDHLPGFIDSHPEICGIADTLTSWEARTRYEYAVIVKEEVVSALGLAESFFEEIFEIEKRVMSQKETGRGEGNGEDGGISEPNGPEEELE